MHEHINKHAKMQRCKQAKKAKQDGTKQAKQACYHIKGKGKHAIRHTKRLTREPLTCKAKQKRKKASGKQAQTS